jgi:hypothetical protein
MTHEEQIVKLTEMLVIQQKLHETAIDMLKPAIEAEREACAKLCDYVYDNIVTDEHIKDMAFKIRARGQA